MTWIRDLRDFLNEASDGLSKVWGKGEPPSSEPGSTPESPAPPVTPPW